MKWVTQVRYDAAGHVERVMWRNVDLNPLHLGFETEAEVIEAVDAIHRGVMVKAGLLRDFWSVNLRVVHAGGGFETIADDETERRPGRRLADLPEF